MNETKGGGTELEWEKQAERERLFQSGFAKWPALLFYKGGG